MRRLLPVFILLALLAIPVSVSAVPITLNAYSVGNWQYGGTTATLKIFANQDFLTSDGQLIKAGNATNGSGWYQSITCAVSGTTVTIPSIINFPTTTDSLTVPTATFTARFYTGTIARDYFLINVQVKHTYASPQTWDQLIVYNTPQGPPPDRTYPTFDQVGALIGAVLPCSNSSEAVKGCTKLSVAPALSTNPIARGDNDSREAVATGSATLSAGQVVVSSASALTGYRILVTGQDDNVSGALRATNIVNGVSFTITSSNGADSGTVFWSLFKP